MDATVVRKRKSSAWTIWSLRAVVLAFFLLGWQYVPQITGLRHISPIFNPFFVSSPSRVAILLYQLSFAKDGQTYVWPFLANTLKATFIGVAIGSLLGAFFGLIVSNNARTRQVLSPFIVFFNSAPRIAFVPIFVIIAGATLTANILTAVIVIFFLVFYNAYSGGSSVPAVVVNNARILGASSREIMWQIRLPYVFVWTFASMPNAISFGIVAVVTAEILDGTKGMGQLLSQSIASVDATLTFSVVVLLSIVGALLVGIAEWIEKRTLHWWQPIQ